MFLLGMSFNLLLCENFITKEAFNICLHQKLSSYHRFLLQSRLLQVHKKQCYKINLLNAYFVTSGLNRRKLNDFTRTNIEGTEEVERKDSDEDTKESLNIQVF